MQQSQIEAISRVAHEANRAYCQTIGDNSQKPFDEATEWQKSSCRDGIRAICEGRVKEPGDSHRSWLIEKARTGWKFGPVKNEDTKEHPCMVQFDELSAAEQVKDHIFVGVVKSMIAGYGL